jgi:quercetin dioxygenase-like cupin family protein
MTANRRRTHRRRKREGSAASGAASTSVVYFELEPGNRLSPHTHTAEEVLLILEGTAEAILGEGSTTLDAGGMTVIPANVAHNVANAGSGTLRAVGFFPSAAIVNVYEHLIMPMRTRVLVFPSAGDVGPESEGSR